MRIALAMHLAMKSENDSVGTGALQGALGGIYRITADGQYSVLRTFPDDGGPLESNAALVRAVDGNF